MNKTVRDHNGAEFRSISEMCKYWSISESTYRSRVRKGLSLKEALTRKATNTRTNNSNNKVVTDNLGNTFKNEAEMKKYWGLIR